MATSSGRKAADAAEKAASEARTTARRVADEAEKVQERVANDMQAAGDRVRELNEQIFDNIKNQGTAALDAYESALERLLEFQKKMADSSQLEWVSALADAQIGFVTSVSQAYTSAVREMLK